MRLAGRMRASPQHLDYGLRNSGNLESRKRMHKVAQCTDTLSQLSPQSLGFFSSNRPEAASCVRYLLSCLRISSIDEMVAHVAKNADTLTAALLTGSAGAPSSYELAVLHAALEAKDSSCPLEVGCFCTFFLLFFLRSSSLLCTETANAAYRINHSGQKHHQQNILCLIFFFLWHCHPHLRSPGALSLEPFETQPCWYLAHHSVRLAIWKQV